LGFGRLFTFATTTLTLSFRLCTFAAFTLSTFSTVISIIVVVIVITNVILGTLSSFAFFGTLSTFSSFAFFGTLSTFSTVISIIVIVITNVILGTLSSFAFFGTLSFIFRILSLSRFEPTLSISFKLFNCCTVTGAVCDGIGYIVKVTGEDSKNNCQCSKN
jgi:hypothetical protein